MGEFNDPFCYLYFDGCVVIFWSLRQEDEGSNVLGQKESTSSQTRQSHFWGNINRKIMFSQTRQNLQSWHNNCPATKCKLQ